MTNVKCNVILALLVFLGLNNLSAQENVVKLGLGSLIIGYDVNLKYERAFAEKHSVQLAVLWDTPENFPGSGFAAGLVDGTGYTVDDIQGRLGGFAVVPEYRYYFSQAGALRGFYGGVYGKLRNRNYNKTGDFNTDIEVDARLNLRSVGFGLGIGAQWLIKDAFAIDWYIGGLGYVNHSLRASVAPTNQEDFDELKSEIILGADDWKLDPASDDVDPEVAEAFNTVVDEFKDAVSNTDVGTFRTPRIPFSTLDIRAGLSVGYAF